jgi:cytochrome b pre-mRNA-processing protein 3
MPLASLFRRNRHRDAALSLYSAIVAQARAPVFFTGFGVPDTFDGRFELIALHAFLVLNRLKAERPRTAALAEALRRNLYGTVTAADDRDIAGIAAYLRRCVAEIAAQPVARLIAGEVSFAALPAAAGAA